MGYEILQVTADRIRGTERFNFLTRFDPDTTMNVPFAGPITRRQVLDKLDEIEARLANPDPPPEPPPPVVIPQEIRDLEGHRK